MVKNPLQVAFFHNALISRFFESPYMEVHILYTRYHETGFPSKFLTTTMLTRSTVLLKVRAIDIKVSVLQKVIYSTIKICFDSIRMYHMKVSVYGTVK